MNLQVLITNNLRSILNYFKSPTERSRFGGTSYFGPERCGFYFSGKRKLTCTDPLVSVISLYYNKRYADWSAQAA
ncbi:hypothetical protein [Marivirga lumbricoides]|uniref:hypothetical protein n=1 Tax=Marivirga lumbricoides TaxID=1046115 RepID=UPI001E2EDAE9